VVKVENEKYGISALLVGPLEYVMGPEKGYLNVKIGP